MIGTPVECTIWKVTWRHRRAGDDPSAIEKENEG